ncbi:MAG: hypothetical protein M0R47_18980 [Methylobacter sp.]|uniref:hypothetical protein n=1 Tax=Methylobacter sp. TaxID=2051955 RepID=UPI0025FC6E3F|nr:hypothetical protein [Methylobacter sp.]MCK9622606.1 hypothetical protein [Methylobacter sp.]
MIDYPVLKQAILNNVDCQPYIILNSDPKDPNYLAKDTAIANIFNTPQGTRLIERFENFIGLMGALGIPTYNSIMRALEVVASDPLMNDFILAIRSSKGINFGDPQTHTTLDGMVQTNVFTQPQADALKNLSIVPSSLAYDTVSQPITPADVSIALRNY